MIPGGNPQALDSPAGALIPARTIDLIPVLGNASIL